MYLDEHKNIVLESAEDLNYDALAALFQLDPENRHKLVKLDLSRIYTWYYNDNHTYIYENSFNLVAFRGDFCSYKNIKSIAKILSESTIINKRNSLNDPYGGDATEELITDKLVFPYYRANFNSNSSLEKALKFYSELLECYLSISKSPEKDYIDFLGDKVKILESMLEGYLEEEGELTERNSQAISRDEERMNKLRTAMRDSISSYTELVLKDLNITE